MSALLASVDFLRFLRCSKARFTRAVWRPSFDGRRRRPSTDGCTTAVIFWRPSDGRHDGRQTAAKIDTRQWRPSTTAVKWRPLNGPCEPGFTRCVIWQWSSFILLQWHRKWRAGVLQPDAKHTKFSQMTFRQSSHNLLSYEWYLITAL